VVVLDADLAHATMTQGFAEKYPERFFNAGIAEANMVSMAAGLSTMGYIPFCSTFAIFGVGRAYEQVRNSVAYPNFNVKLCMTHAG
ncbi:MAG: transketolase family protein, partial [Hydrogenoanaerobacterium sp.]